MPITLEYNLNGPTTLTEALPDSKAPLNRTKEKVEPRTVTLSSGENIELKNKADLDKLKKEIAAIGPRLSNRGGPTISTS